MADKHIIDAMWDDSPIDVSTEVNFIWSIANKLRGTYQSDKYKDVIIPMVIIRRFECALAPTKQKVVEQFKATDDCHRNDNILIFVAAVRSAQFICNGPDKIHFGRYIHRTVIPHDINNFFLRHIDFLRRCFLL